MPAAAVAAVVNIYVVRGKQLDLRTSFRVTPRAALVSTRHQYETFTE